MTCSDQRAQGSRALLTFLVAVAAGLAGVPLRPTPAAAAGVVGTGTRESCTEAALDAALAGGGLVAFDCGAEPGPITIVASKAIAADTIIDGANLITIVAGEYSAARCHAFRVEAGVEFTVERLTIDIIANDGGTVRITDSSVGDNSCIGIDNRGGSVSATRTFFGGFSGIQNVDGAVQVTGGTFFSLYGIRNSKTGVADVANSTFSTGGCPLPCVANAIVNDNGSVTVTNATVSARYGSTISNYGGEVTLRNTIVVGTCEGGVTDGGHNIEDGASCGFDEAHGSLSRTDPRLDWPEPQDHGGAHMDVRLASGKPGNRRWRRVGVC